MSEKEAIQTIGGQELTIIRLRTMIKRLLTTTEFAQLYMTCEYSEIDKGIIKEAKELLRETRPNVEKALEP